jgi:predicted dehydrogenase
LRIADLTSADAWNILRRAKEMKDGNIRTRTLDGRVIILIFEKSSTRTRVSFEVAVRHLGGQTIFMTPVESQLGRSEPLKDTARCLSRYADGMVVRTFGQEKLETLVLYSSIPVINALSDEHHPCQVLSDVLSMYERTPDLGNLRVAWVGDGNNMAHAFIDAAALYGFELALACPEGYRPDPAVVAAAQAGKEVFCEKPLALTREQAAAMLTLARHKRLCVGCAPDTFMGAGIQTCRKLIDDGWIGQPVAATAFMLSHGPESWHPNPFFFYQPGAGPLFDMGPYYLTALVSLLGPVRRVTASARASFPERIATSKEHYGERIPVNTATHVAGVLDFASGVVGTLIMSFDVWAHTLPRIEIYGSEGSLAVPDPNTFGGPVLVRRAGDRDWREAPLTHNPDTGRGIGPADLAYAARSGRPHRASGDLAYHVLDLMHAFLEASESGQHIVVQSTCTRPAPLPMGLLPGTLDE